MPRFVYRFTWLVLLNLVRCAGPLNETIPKSQAQILYESAMEDLEDGLYPEAIKTLTEIKTKFPYSAYAVLADLRMGDTHYERGQFSEAIDAYRDFLKMHPMHGEGVYAAFRIAEAFYEQMPSDWFFLPPSEEKDQASTRLAVSAYREVVVDYPQSEFAVKAQEKIAECRTRLGKHELYVAKFYFKREKYEAARARAENMLRDYKNLGLDSEALWISGESNRYLGDLKQAGTAYSRLLAEFKDSDFAKKARSRLHDLPEAKETKEL